MSIIFFSNTNDSGEGSFRQAVADAVDGDVIVNDSNLKEFTITLQSIIIIDKRLTIKPSRKFCFSGNNAARAFEVQSPGAGSEFYDILVVDCVSPYPGAGVRVYGKATFNRCSFLNNYSTGSTIHGVYIGEDVEAFFNSCVFYSNKDRVLYAATPAKCHVIRCTSCDNLPQSSLDSIDSIFQYTQSANLNFVDAANLNFHLKKTSSYTKGSSDLTVTIDNDGNPYRTDGTGSLGAFENYDVGGVKSIFWRGANAAGRVDDPANWSAERFGASLQAFPDDLGSYTARILEPSNVVLNGDATEAGSASALTCPVVIGGFCRVENLNEEATTAPVILSEGSFLSIGPEVALEPRRISSDVENVGVAIEGRATLQGNCLVNLDEVDLKAGGQLVVNNGPSVNSYAVPGGALLELAPDAEYSPMIAYLELAGSLVVRAARCSVLLLKIPSGATGAALFITAPSGWSTAVDAKASLTVETSTAFDDGAVVYFSSLELADGANVLLKNTSNVLFSVPLNADLTRFLNADGGALCETVARRGATVSRVAATSDGSQCLLTVERDGTDGDFLVQACPASHLPYLFEGRNIEGFSLATAEGYNVRCFDGQEFKEGFCARKYYFVGSYEAGGDFKNKSDWSLTEGGVEVDAIPTIKEGVFIVE